MRAKQQLDGVGLRLLLCAKMPPANRTTPHSGLVNYAVKHWHHATVGFAYIDHQRCAGQSVRRAQRERLSVGEEQGRREERIEQ